MHHRFAQRRFIPLALAALLVAACGDPDLGTTGAGGSSSSSSSAAGASGGGGAGGTAPASLDDILAELRAHRDQAMLDHAADSGWPVPVKGGWLFVSLDANLDKTAGDHDAWAGTQMTHEMGFSWVVIDVPEGEHYKFTDGTTFLADPFARSYAYDNFGEISLVAPKDAHLDRWLAVGDANMEPRALRVWVPATQVTHTLYVHDGQNLFDPDAFFGGWHLADGAPAGMMFVGIDNTPARFDEYTHVQDVISGQTAGGKGEAYADFLKGTVRPLIQERYGEPAKIGVMGSSLGGLISLVIADRHPNDYVFAASLSGTQGWGSIGAGVHNETIIQRYAAHGHEKPVLYVDSGGDGPPCADTDGDGTEDDTDQGDNFCENAQLRDVLISKGYTDQQDLFYWWEQGATHDEAHWAARVFRPLQIFDGL